MILGIAGKARCGKDTVASFIEKDYGFYPIAFADNVKTVCKMIFGATDEQLYGEEKEKIDKRYGISPRQMMQGVGQAIRNFYPDAWINAFLLRIKGWEDEYVCVTDIRFVNEFNAIKAHGGKIIKVTRNIEGTKSVDISEKDLDNIPDDKFDAIINNSGTLEDLRMDVRIAMNELGIEALDEMHRAHWIATINMRSGDYRTI